MPNEIHSHMRWNLYTFLVKHFSLTGWQSFAVMAGCLLLCMVIPYLLGSFNFGLIISRRKYHDDIRIHGSGNAGTTNMLRTYGPKAAALTLVGDMLKAALAVILGYLLVNNQAVAYNEAGRFIGVFGDKPGAAVAGLFVVVGHMFPCFFRFRGGKGVATTGMVRDGVNIQQKFVHGDHLWGLTKVQEHLQKYPDFIKQGGKYQIPADFYEKVKRLLNMPPEEASRLQSGNGDGFTYSQWNKVQDFFRNSGISPNDIEPASLNYADVQVNATDQTFVNERNKIQEMDQENRNRAYEASKPTVQEAAKAAGVSAAFEGGTAFCIGVYKKLKAGRKISEFTAEDWKELGIDTAKGTGAGGIRGAAIYGMTNFTATPAAIASACVTAAIGMVAQSKKLRAGEISEDDFVNSSEVLCLDVSVSAVASLIGQTVIPIPLIPNLLLVFRQSNPLVF